MPLEKAYLVITTTTLAESWQTFSAGITIATTMIRAITTVMTTITIMMIITAAKGTIATARIRVMARPTGSLFLMFRMIPPASPSISI